jgi:DNA-directed RNA polymerase subunit RPC12/RpoP
MSLRLLRCPNCGADLEITEGVETVRCRFCGARCQLEGRGAKAHLSLISAHLERIEGHAARTAVEIEAIRQQQAHGLASQFATDDALRRAAAAQEAAAIETAYAARVGATVGEAFIYAGAQLSAQQEAERQQLLSLRSHYRTWRVLEYVGGISVMFLVFVVGTIAVVVAGPKDSQALMFFLGVLPASVGFAIVTGKIAKSIWTKAGRAYNERAFLYGLPDVRVKSRAEADWDRESKRIDKEAKRAWGTPKSSGVGGLIVLGIAGAIALTLWSKCSGTPEANRQSQPAEPPAANTPANEPQTNGLPSSAPTPADNSAKPPSNASATNSGG